MEASFPLVKASMINWILGYRKVHHITHPDDKSGDDKEVTDYKIAECELLGLWICVNMFNQTVFLENRSFLQKFKDWEGRAFNCDVALKKLLGSSIGSSRATDMGA